jgi:GNAT superfamily N-acetyltransferase
MDYKVRMANVEDATAFSLLLASLGYPNSPESLTQRIELILKNPDAVLLVAASATNQAVGLLSLHFIPQLGIEGDVTRIGFFVIDENFQGSGIGKLLESHAEAISRERGCNRMVSP